MSMRIELKQEDLYVDWVSLRQGILQYTCWANEVPMPVGMAWVLRYTNHGGLNQAHLMHIFTVPFARRNKVATKLLREILQHCDSIVTGTGSKEGGEGLLTAFGFKYDDWRCDWAYITKAPTGLIPNEKAQP